MKYKTLHPEVKVLSASEGIVEYVASDESVDAQGEIVLTKGWRFNRFRKNAPFLDSHRGATIGDQLGVVLSGVVEGGQLIEQVKWAIDVPENDLARLGFSMTDKGYLKAVSVGFDTVQAVKRGEMGWKAAIADNHIPPEKAAKAVKIFLEQEQLELSAVVIGSNPNALVKAYEEGAVSEEELASCGFAGDAEYEFLTKAAFAMERPECDAAFKALISVEMGRIYQQRKQISGKSTVTKGHPARQHATAEVIKRRAEQREYFLTQLDGLTK